MDFATPTSSPTQNTMKLQHALEKNKMLEKLINEMNRKNRLLEDENSGLQERIEEAGNAGNALYSYIAANGVPEGKQAPALRPPQIFVKSKKPQEGMEIIPEIKEILDLNELNIKVIKIKQINAGIVNIARTDKEQTEQLFNVLHEKLGKNIFLK